MNFAKCLKTPFLTEHIWVTASMCMKQLTKGPGPRCQRFLALKKSQTKFEEFEKKISSKNSKCFRNYENKVTWGGPVSVPSL